MGIQQFAGTGYYVDDVQTTQTDQSQMMTSHEIHTSQSHKRIAQTNRTNKIMSRTGMEMQVMLSDAPEQLRCI